MVLANGKMVLASDNDDRDLFWAIRGEGGNFGIVTKFEFQLHPVGPEIRAGLIVFPLEQAKQVLQRYRDYVAAAPRELNVWAVMRDAPPLPFLPENVHGRKIVALTCFYNGNAAQGEKLIEPIRGCGTPYGEHIGPMPYAQWQQAFDPLLTPGARNYWKSHNFTELSDGVLDTMIQYAAKLPSPHCEIFVGLIAGAYNEVPRDATAFYHRDAKFAMNVHGRWTESGDDDRCVAWSREFFKASQPYASAGAYVNFMTAEETERVSGAYGENYPRLVELKRRYDLENLFHLNQNISV